MEIDDFHRISVPGVWAAGDMALRASLPMPLAFIPGAASGAIAAVAIDQDLLAADFALTSHFAMARA